MTRALRPQLLHPITIASLGLLSALLVGALLAESVALGLSLAIAIAYLPLVFLNLPLALAAWVVLVFLAGFPGLQGAPTASSIMLLLAWVGTLDARAPVVRIMAKRHARLVLLLVVYIVWVALSVAWARDPGRAATNLLSWGIVLATFVVVATTATTRGAVRTIAAAFVTGAVVAVVLAKATAGLQPAASAVKTASIADGRLQSGASDPNYLAAVIVGALVLAGGLAAYDRRDRVRLPLAGGALILLYGLLATQSRGGLIGAVAAVVCALVVFKRNRGVIVLGIVSLCAFAAVYVALRPYVLERVTATNGGGSGRSELWSVAWEVAKANPIVGVGGENFVVVEGDYLKQAAPQRFTELIGESPHVVHNAYLQALAETGVIGLVLFLVVVVALLRTFLLAARRFEELGDPAMATLARALFVGVIGMLVASVFLSNATDRRYWILFALGPAMLAAAARDGATARDGTSV